MSKMEDEMRKIKKVLSAVLAATMVMALSACGSTAETGKHESIL